MSSSSSTNNDTTSSINPDLLMGSKLRAHYQQTFREHVSAPTSSFAKKQLEKMGWSEGTGLGKKRDGIKTHIKVKKRKDGVGLGGSDNTDVVAVNEAMGEWWKDGLGATLARLGNKQKKSKDKKSKKKAKKFTDEELFEATGGTRFGMRAGITTNLHKWKRTEEGAASDGSEDNIKTAAVVSEESVESTKEAKKSKKRKVEEEAAVENNDDNKKKSKKDKKQEKKRKLDTVDSTEEADNEKLRREKKKAKKAKKKKSKD